MYRNPFSDDPDRAEIWTMLVERDILAFCRADWSMVADDFIADGFMGLDGGKIPNPDQWRIKFSNLRDYQEEWLSQAKDFQNGHWMEDPQKIFHDLTDCSQIEVEGDVALAHKKFDGFLTRANGEKVILNWQTLYQCRKQHGQWKIAGFLGYLPYPLGIQDNGRQKKS